jgi:hypothetical protein
MGFNLGFKGLRCISLPDAMFYSCFSLLHYAWHVLNQSVQHQQRPLVLLQLFFCSIIFCYTVTYPLARAAIHVSVLLILLQVTPHWVLVTILAWTVLYTSVTNSEHVYTMSVVWAWHTSISIIYTNYETNEELDKLIKHGNIINHIKAQRLSWFGHVQRTPDTRTVKKIFNWKPLTKRSQDPSTDRRITSHRISAKWRSKTG